MSGPNRDDVQKIKGRPVNQVVVQDYDRPGQNINRRELKIYKPNVQQEHGERRKSAPANVEELNKVKPVAERYRSTQPRNSNQWQGNNQKKGEAK